MKSIKSRQSILNHNQKKSRQSAYSLAPILSKRMPDKILRNKYVEIIKIILYFTILYAFYVAFAFSMWHLYLVINPQTNKTAINSTTYSKIKVQPLSLQLDDSKDLIPNEVIREKEQKILCQALMQNTTAPNV